MGVVALPCSVHNHLYDGWIMNVPEDRAEKFDYNYWPDEGELDDYLDPPSAQT